MENLDSFIALCSDPRTVSVCFVGVGICIGFISCTFFYLCDEIYRLIQAYRHSKINK